MNLTTSDRCPGCPKPLPLEAEAVTDARGRRWHPLCAAAALADADAVEVEREEAAGKGAGKFFGGFEFERRG